MKKFMVWSCMLVFVASSTPAFAQWVRMGKMLEGSKINAARLERAVGKVGMPPAVKPAVIPAHLKMGKQVLVGIPKLPTVGDNVSASYLYKMHELTLRANAAGEKPSAQDVQRWMANEWAHGSHQNTGKGNMFYDDQAELARDLNKFYNGSGVTVKSPNGRMIKIYMLPVDNILYKPAGFAEPVVLSAQDDFVIYDVEAQTGQLVENTPQMRQFFSRPAKSGAWEEVIALGGRIFEMPQGEPDWELVKGVKKAPQPEPEGDFEELYFEPQPEGDFKEVDAESLPQDLSFGGVNHLATEEEFEELMHLNEQAGVPLKIHEFSFGGAARLGTPEEVYEIKKIESQQNLAGENKAAKLTWKEGHFPHLFDSANKLGEQLHRFHRGNAVQVEDVTSKQVSYVYEIPVTGLYLLGENDRVYPLDPATEVVLFNEHTGGQIVKREILESQQVYKFVQ